MSNDGLRHFFLDQSGSAVEFTSKQQGGKKQKNPDRIRAEHGVFIRRQLEEAWHRAQSIQEERKAVSLPTKEGIYLEFASSPEFDLALKSLEYQRSGIRLLSVRKGNEEGKDIQKATVFIPSGKENYFLKKVQAYIEEDSRYNKPKNQALIESLNDIRLAVLESFWHGKYEWIPNESTAWCEIWLSEDTDEAEQSFRELARQQLHIELQPERLCFPERRVILGKVNRQQLKDLVIASPHIAEFRRASETADAFVDLDNMEQTEWARDLLGRLRVNQKSNVCICILDTGVNNGHILLSPLLHDQDCSSYEESWGTHDHEGHGTKMAGLALYGDLQAALETSAAIEVEHKLESMKILPPRGENDPKLFGAIVTRSVSQMIIEHPERDRILCMAVTSPKYTVGDGSPSSWSAAIDELASGYLDEQQKLIIISAGNVTEMDDWSRYPDSNKTWSVQNPGQAWNAVTVGAYTEKTEVDKAKYNDCQVVASCGGLSPYSSTSYLWDKKWPIKPDVVFEGGNLMQDSFGCTQCTELSLLTLHHKPTESQFSTIWATSAATAQAAHMAAQIQAAYPQAWPETIRALLIHSADWTDEMKRQFLAGDDKKDYHELLRICGYGVPRLQKALWCMRNSVNLVIQSELQPYDKKTGLSGYKTKDMHIHELPWPRDLLLDLGETPVTLRVTLSYFIEPGPGEIGWKDRYRYPSCLLRFDVNGTDSQEAFLGRINAAAAIEESEGVYSSGSVDWTLGVQNRHKGSIHSDTWHTTAAQLATSNYVGVYPAVGWWRERAWLGRWNRTVRYALVVSAETPEQSVDLYTPIETMIKTLITV